MPLDPELIELMNQEVAITPKSGKDKYNNFVYGEPLWDGLASPGHVKCYIAREAKRVLDVQGRETTSTVQVILAVPELEFDENATIELPDGSTPAIIEVLSSFDDTGPYHLEVRA